MKSLTVSVLFMLVGAFNVGNSNQQANGKPSSDGHVNEAVYERLYDISDSLGHVIKINDKIIQIRQARIDSLQLVVNNSMPTNQMQ